MPAYASLPYRNATKIANRLMRAIMQEQEDLRGLALLVREWMMLENTKRQWRGIPPLAAASLKEIAEYRRSMAKQLDSSRVTITELDEPTTNHPQTVPAPPEGEAPSASSVVNDK